MATDERVFYDPDWEKIKITPKQNPTERKEAEQPKRPRFPERPKKQSKFMLRIKRALAGFLRDELLDYIGYNHKIPFMSLQDRFKVDDSNFENLIMEVVIPLEFESVYPPDEYRLENAIRDAKEDFAQKVMSYIHVDAQNLTTEEHYMRRSVKLSLTVRSKRE